VDRKTNKQPDASQNPRFSTTKWSVVLRAGLANSETSQQALAELIEAYWYPLYVFARRSGTTHHDAMDHTQGFFMHLLSGGGLGTVSPDKGRFRSFLLASFKNFMANQRRAAAAIRRGGAVSTLSLSTVDFGSRYDREPVNDETPEVLFERRWVETLLQRVRTRLGEEYGRAGKHELFQLLGPHLIDAENATPRDEIGRRMNLSSAAVAMSIHRMRRRFGELLRQEVAATVNDPAETEDELRTLMAIVSCRV
jgi:RNA polymerase sigma-70 factor (ECF subfamily)